MSTTDHRRLHGVYAEVPASAPASQAPPRPLSPRWRVFADWAVIAAGLVVFCAIPHSVRGDGQARYDALDRLLREGVTMSTRYSVVGPLFATPLYFLGRMFGSPAAACGWFNLVLFVSFLFVSRRELRDEIDATTLRTFLILLVFGSMFPSHIQFFYGEVFTALFVSLGIFLLARNATLVGWAAITIGAVNTPASVVGVAFVGAVVALRTRRWRWLVMPFVVFALTRIECFVFRGDLFHTGYEQDGAGPPSILPYDGLPGFSYPLFFGVLSILFSFGKGIVYFMPGLLVPVPRDLRARSPRAHWAGVVILAFLAGLVLAYAKWWAWQGGWFWGPRFFLIGCIPACFSIAANVRRAPEHGLARNALVLGALTLSFWVGVDGLVFDTFGLDFCQKDTIVFALCHTVPELSVLWHPLVAFESTVPASSRGLALAVCGFWALIYVYVGWGLFGVVQRQSRTYAGGLWERYALGTGWRL
ncbi:MAG TPA: hypothetical protein VNO21_25195 [Polyangiaceae bacterium]|nr:hypothetical protein [Polyangiaceae bacterium]